MKIGSKGLDLVKSFEGLYLKAYKCPAGVWTIGYGHTGKVGGKSICSGMKISKSKATSLLKDDMAASEKAVQKYVKVKLNQNRFDALVSFTFNCGAGALQKSTLLKKLNAGKYSEAADGLMAWNKGGGRVLAGLTRRRAAERELFYLPVVRKTYIYTWSSFIKALQKSVNLKASGKPTQSLLRALPSITSSKNNKHKSITALKKRLKKLGYTITNTNAKYDDELKKAVIRYKKAHSFESTTGTIGVAFWEKILKL